MHTVKGYNEAGELLYTENFEVLSPKLKKLIAALIKKKVITADDLEDENDE